MRAPVLRPALSSAHVRRPKEKENSKSYRHYTRKSRGRGYESAAAPNNRPEPGDVKKANLIVCHRIDPTIHERGYGNAIETEKRKKSGRLNPETA